MPRERSPLDGEATDSPAERAEAACLQAQEDAQDGQRGNVMAKSAKNFGSKADYQKWLAYGHMHGEFDKSPGNTPVKIKGKARKVNHADAKKAK